VSEQRYSKNPLIKGAEVIAHFQNRENPLTEDEIVKIITDREVARQAIQEGRITKKERYRLIEQAKENLASREGISELKNIKYLEMPDISSDANNINEIEEHLEKKQSPADRYKRQDRYMRSESTTPLILGGINDSQGIKDLIKAEQTKIERKPSDIGPWGEKGARRVLREPAGLRYGADYTDIVRAPGRAGVSSGLIGGIRESVSSDSAARAERKAMQEAVKKMITADQANINNAGRGLRQVHDAIARNEKEILNNFGYQTTGQYPYTPKVTALVPEGGVVDYPDQRSYDELIDRELGLRTRQQLMSMKEDEYVAAYGGMGAQQFIDNYSTLGENMSVAPKIDITLETTNFVNKLRDMEKQGFNVTDGSMTNIRSANELDAIVRELQQRASRGELKNTKGDTRKMYLDKPIQQGNKSKKNIYADQEKFGVLEVLNALGYRDNEKRYLAMALDQIQQARRNKVNEQSKRAYMTREKVQGPARPHFYYDDAEAIDGRTARIPLLQLEQKFAVGGGDASAGALQGNRDALKQSSLSGRVYKGRDREAIIANNIERAIEARGKAIQANAPDRGRDEFEQKMAKMRDDIEITERTQKRSDEDLKRRAAIASQIIETLPPVGRRSTYPRQLGKY
tara:strand:+ start:279 stop:2165 length:1887 start_codon:yes stop_codon:yes gene_type:complete